MDLKTKTEAEAVIEFAREELGTSVQSFDTETGDAQLLLHPRGLSVIDVAKTFEYRLANPRRRIQRTTLTDERSLIAHVLRYKSDSSTTLFASMVDGSPTLTAIYNDHEPTDMGSEGLAGGLPGFADDRAVYAFPISKPWRTWIAADQENLPQAVFARLIEDNVLDIADPSIAGEGAKAFVGAIGASFASPSKIMEVSRGLSLTVTEKVTQAVSLATGEVQLSYASTHDGPNGAGSMKVPGAFLLAIPVFEGGALYQIPVRVRYRSKEGAILWSLVPYRAEATFEHAVREVCDRVAAATSVPLFYGAR